jgi:hypothetical protein
MNESRDDITNEPPRREDGFAEQSTTSTYDDDYLVDPAELLRQRKRQRKWLIEGCSVGITLLVALLAGLAITFVTKARQEAQSRQERYNTKLIVLAMNNVASNTSTGDIPPSYGEVPVGSGHTASFFEHLLPFIDESGLNFSQQRDVPIKTYIAPHDPRNKGKDGTISYCSNATLLNGQPRLPQSFNGRTSSTICVMERSGLDGAHKWSNQNNYLGAPGQPPPFPQVGVDPSAYLDGSPQGFWPTGCFVGMGDGSSRYVTTSESNCWNWACDPALTGSQPSNW